MIKKLTLLNFKSIESQVFDFSQFDLLVGPNNSGKSTILQALAIWQFSIDEFHRSKRTGSTGIQIVLPNFTALPVPEFNLLWRDRTDRHWPLVNGTKKQEYILVCIRVHWSRADGTEDSLGVELRYHSPQTIYAIPADGWDKFRACDKDGDLPRIAYVPPFSGLEPAEKWMDISPIRQQVGKGQPGSVLRNLLLRVYKTSSDGTIGSEQKAHVEQEDWKELSHVIKRWFGVDIHKPEYESEKDVYIKVYYKQRDKRYDVISGGSGFHQTLTLLAFLYGYHPTTILLDEPDAHLHVNLQRKILDYFKAKSLERGVQFLIATHAEEFVRGVDATQIVSLLSQKPNRIPSSPAVIRAMADVSNEEIMALAGSPYILYVEGENDERIIRSWASKCGAGPVIDKFYFRLMRGGTKDDMRKRADDHFESLRHVIPVVCRKVLFDYDEDNSYHPLQNNPCLIEWQRKNIENYLLVPDAWIRAAINESGRRDGKVDLLNRPLVEIIESFFAGENLTLPPNGSWKTVSANIFKKVDGKRILFEDDNSLFHRLRNASPSVELIRGTVAMHMSPDEIHDDVHNLIASLRAMVEPNIV